MPVLLLALLLALLGLQWSPGRWPIPRPRIAHFMPYLLGDALDAIRRARLLGYRYIDQNLQATRDGFPVVAHWGILQRNGYLYRWTGEHYRNGREVRVKMAKPVSIQDHDWAYVQTFRTRARGGQRPRLALAHMRAAKARGMTLCLEVKGSRGFVAADGLVWKRLEGWAEQTGARVVIMTLTNMGPIGRVLHVCQAATRHNFPVALLPRTPKPKDWAANWAPMRPAVWGRWR